MEYNQPGARKNDMVWGEYIKHWRRLMNVNHDNIGFPFSTYHAKVSHLETTTNWPDLWYDIHC